MNLDFDLLTASEIECRVGTVKYPDPKKNAQGGVSLLLYKDARCDMARLDKTVGAMGWQRSHTRDNANCIVSIWDDEKKVWVSKEDVGVASRTEAEKGLASDSFKRACVNWGIGRELYTAPFIWVSGDPDSLKWERFKVKAIGYDKNRCINALTIINKQNKVVFQMGKIEEVEPDTPDATEEKPTVKQDAPATVTAVKTLPTVNPVQKYLNNEIAFMSQRLEISDRAEMSERFASMRKSLIDGGVIPDIKSDKLTMEQAKDMIEAMYVTFFTDGDKKCSAS
jgi:hypothetical protein